MTSRIALLILMLTALAPVPGHAGGSEIGGGEYVDGGGEAPGQKPGGVFRVLETRYSTDWSDGKLWEGETLVVRALVLAGAQPPGQDAVPKSCGGDLASDSLPGHAVQFDSCAVTAVDFPGGLFQLTLMIQFPSPTVARTYVLKDLRITGALVTLEPSHIVPIQVLSASQLEPLAAADFRFVTASKLPRVALGEEFQLTFAAHGGLPLRQAELVFRRIAVDSRYQEIVEVPIDFPPHASVSEDPTVSLVVPARPNSLKPLPPERRVARIELIAVDLLDWNLRADEQAIEQPVSLDLALP